MNRLHMLVALGIVAAWMSYWQPSPSASAKTHLLPDATFEADDKTVKAVLTVFDRAERAIQDRDQDTLMALYSNNYSYHGLKKPDIRKIWADLFDNYRKIESTHLFTRIVKVGGGSNTTVEITCTGGLWATSKTSGLRVPIDSWYSEIHYLTYEDGAWRVRGNAGEAPTVLPFGTAPHPLF